MTAPVYDLLVVLHVLSAVIGFGSVGVSGAYAARGRSSASPRQDATLLRYFHPGTNWAERTLLVTPVLGAIVLFAGDRSAASEVWPWIGLGAWAFAAAMATAWCWPAERRIQAWLSGDAATRKGRRRRCRRWRRRRWRRPRRRRPCRPRGLPQGVPGRSVGSVGDLDLLRRGRRLHGRPAALTGAPSSPSRGGSRFVRREGASIP